MFKNIYKNRVVLVTGHTGFKGSWLSIWLRELGAHVVGFSLEPPSEPSNFIATRLKNKISHLHGDIREIDQLSAAFREYQPEFVFHLAAQPLVRLSYEEPKLTFDTNLGGTVNVLEAVRSSPSVKVLINITSDKCYENKEWTWGYRENDPMGGHDPYSASKGCAELAFNAYLRSFFAQNASSGKSIGAASVRAGNVIGGGEIGERIACFRIASVLSAAVNPSAYVAPNPFGPGNMYWSRSAVIYGSEPYSRKTHSAIPGHGTWARKMTAI